MDTQQRYVFNVSQTRITKAISPDIHNIFHNEVGEHPYLNKDIRDRIINKWMIKYPAIPKGNLRTYLHRLEMKMMEEKPQWSQKSLINKITYENEGLKERILSESSQDITKQAKAINDLDKLTAQINKLTDAPPAVSIIINSNVNEDELTKAIADSFSENKVFDVESHTSSDLSSENGGNKQDDQSTNSSVNEEVKSNE
jgi:hypothetical protein